MRERKKPERKRFSREKDIEFQMEERDRVKRRIITSFHKHFVADNSLFYRGKIQDLLGFLFYIFLSITNKS